MRLSFFVLMFFLISSCGQEIERSEKESVQKEPVNVSNSLEYTVIAVEYPETGWGYQILQDGKLAIDQKHIPVIQGYRGFSSKENAEKAANFIVGKMQRGIFPPTMTEEELDSLGVL